MGVTTPPKKYVYPRVWILARRSARQGGRGNNLGGVKYLGREVLHFLLSLVIQFWFVLAAWNIQILNLTLNCMRYSLGLMAFLIFK